MPSSPKTPSPAEGLRQHYATAAELVGQGAGEVEVNAALTAAEQAGLDRTALRMAVREGRIADKERRAEVAVTLDCYRAMLDLPPPLAGLAPPPLTSQPGRHRGPRAASSGDGGRLAITDVRQHPT